MEWDPACESHEQLQGQEREEARQNDREGELTPPKARIESGGYVRAGHGTYQQERRCLNLRHLRFSPSNFRAAADTRRDPSPFARGDTDCDTFVPALSSHRPTSQLFGRKLPENRDL
jgi:hypothetical protein